MNYNQIAVIIDLIVMIVADAVMYIFVKDWDNTMICSFIMIDLSFILNMCAFIFTPNHKNSYIFQSSTSILTAYLIIIEIALMLVAVFVKEIPEPYIMVIEIIVFIAFAIMFAMNVLANNHTAKTADINDAGIARISKVSSRLNGAYNDATDKDIKKAIENAYDKSRAITGFRDELKEYDDELIDLADQIADLAKSNDVNEVQNLCTRFCKLADDRADKARQLQQ